MQKHEKGLLLNLLRKFIIASFASIITITQTTAFAHERTVRTKHLDLAQGLTAAIENLLKLTYACSL